MKARLIKKTDTQATKPEPAKKVARPGGPAVDPRAKFAALFKNSGASK